MKKFIRVERIGPVLGVLAVLCLLIYLFLDPVIKWAIIKAGQAVFGARVNIASVKTKLIKGRLAVYELQVADKSAPMRNLFQWNEAVFDLRPAPLLEKKVVIDEASLSGIKFGAPRKTSGALTLEEKKPGFVGKAVDRLQSQVETIALDKVNDAKELYDPKTIVNTQKLQTTEAATRAKEQITQMPKEVQKQIDQLNAPKRAEDLQARVKALGQKDTSQAAIAQKLIEAKALQTEIQKFQADVTNTQKSVTEQIKSAQSQVENVKKAKDEDWKMIRSKLSLPALDKASMARAVFGPSVVQWGERLFNGVHMARSHMPAKPQSPPPPPRGRARIIEFPRTNDVPRFLLVKAKVAGEVGQERPFGFSGTLTGITTNPPLYGKPATVDLAGQEGSRSFNVKGVLDHTHDIPAESLEGTYNGFSLNNTNFGPSGGGVALGLKQGEGRAHARLAIHGETIEGRAELQGTNLAVDPHVDLKSNSAIAQRATKNITTSLSNVKALNVGVGITGTLESPRLDIDSNIGSIVADALKNALGAEIAEQEKALSAEFEKQTAGQIQQLQTMVDDLQKKALPQLAGNNKVIEDLLAQLKTQTAGPGAGKPLDAIKGLFGH